ncbi:Surface antigen [compost metagenome]
MQIGNHQEIYSEFYQPLDVGSRYFVAPYLLNEAQNIEATLDNDPIAEYRLDRYGYGLNIGRQIANNGEIRFGVAQAFGNAKLRVGDQDLPDFSFDEGYYELKYSFDTMDNVDIPSEGENIRLTLSQHTPSLGDDDRYRQWDLRLDKAISLGADTFVFGGGYGRTLDEANVVVSSFLLGGARQLSGFRQDALAGQNYSLGRVIYYRRLTERSFLPLDFPIYVGGSLERGRVWNEDNSFDTGYINAGSVMFGFETPLGPLSFSYGLNNASEHALYIDLGRNF